MKKIIPILLLMISIPTVFCQEEGITTAAAFGIKEIKTLDMYFGYLPSINKNSWGYAYLNFTPIDGVDRVVAAALRIVEEQTGTTTLRVTINGTPCNTPEITSIIGRSQYVADFECRNVVNRSGFYVVGLQPTGDIYNVHFRIWITYINNPEAQINETIGYIINNIDEVKMLLFDSQETKKYCVNNTLYIERVANITLGNKTYPYLKTEKIECEFGCDEERKTCNYPNWIYYFLILIIIISVYFVIKLVILPAVG